MEYGNILNPSSANLEGDDHVEIWYKYLCGGEDDSVQIRWNISLTNVNRESTVCRLNICFLSIKISNPHYGFCYLQFGAVGTVHFTFLFNHNCSQFLMFLISINSCVSQKLCISIFTGNTCNSGRPFNYSVTHSISVYGLISRCFVTFFSLQLFFFFRIERHSKLIFFSFFFFTKLFSVL